MEQRKSLVRNQEGFTLIEIIAVLVLLGILAAVAVPRYFDLQKDAKIKAVQGAVAEGVARVNQVYAQELLKVGGLPTLKAVTDALAVTGLTDAGDFTITYNDPAPAYSSGKATITVKANFKTNPLATSDIPAGKAIELEFSGAGS
jgi:prepilin-type N-terminal cleavage/methylation domain-containing protein